MSDTGTTTISYAQVVFGTSEAPETVFDLAEKAAAAHAVHARTYKDIVTAERRLLITQDADADASAVSDAVTTITSARSAQGSFAGWLRTRVGEGVDPLRDAEYLFIVELTPSEAWVEPFRDWLDTEHFERQAAMPEVIAVSGYESATGPTTFANVWALSTPDVIDSPAWLEQRDTERWETVKAAFGSGPGARATVRRVSR